NSNASIIKVYGSIKPLKDITLAAKYYNYRLDEKLVSSDNSTVRYPETNLIPATNYHRDYYMKAKKDLGQEIDLIATYDYTEDVQIGLSCGWFFPGDALEGEDGGAKANDDEAVSIIGSVKVVF
ncbi:MAG: alginate export family protein, partial [Candidatus Omnitrophota bacterium]